MITRRGLLPDNAGTDSKVTTSMYDKDEFTCIVCNTTYTIPDEKKKRLEKAGTVHTAVVCVKCLELEVCSLDSYTQYFVIALLGAPASRAMMRKGNLEEALEQARSSASKEMQDFLSMTLDDMATTGRATWRENVGKLVEEYRGRREQRTE